MADKSVLELVDAFNQAQADLEAAKANASALEAENARLEPFEARVAELEAELEVSQSLHREASEGATAHANARDEAEKAVKKAEKQRDVAQKSFEDANAALGELKDELARRVADLEVAEGEIRTLKAFEEKARPVFEATEGLKNALAGF